MAVSQIVDAIEPSIFLPYLIEKTKELSAFWQAGIIKDDQVLNAKMGEGGRTIEFPFWHDLTGTDSVTSDDPNSSIVPHKVDSDEQIATKCFRAVSYAGADLVAAVAGDDPMRVVAERIAPNWNRNMQNTLLNTMNGVFASSAMAADSLIDISDGTTATALTRINADAIIDARGTMGDAADEIKVIAMHSKVYFQLQKNNLIEFVEDSVAKVMIPTYMGMRVVPSDALPKGTNGALDTYTCYLFAPGAIGYGEGLAKNPVAVDRDELAADGEGVEYFISRRHFVVHPYGFKYSGTPAGKSPSNAELADGADWSRVFERKNVPMAALIVNA